MKQTKYMTDYDRHRSAKRRKKRVVAAAITICAAGALAFGIKRLQERSYQTIMTPPVSDSYTETTTTPSLEPVVSKSPEQKQEVTATPTVAPVTVTEAPKVTLQVTEEVEEYDYSQPVPESEAVDDSYFNDAIFIGNSRTQGFLLYSGLADTTGYASRGLNVNSIFHEQVVKDGETKVTVFEAMKNHPEYHKVYIMLGVNELGWSYRYLFHDGYSKIIDEIRSQSPEAQIYIQSILPVTKHKSETDKVYNNQNINEFNAMLKDLAIEKKVYYVNVAEGVEDEEGYLPTEAAFDGVHLKKEYCKKWLAYLKTHTITTK